MYKYKKAQPTTLKVNGAYQGETIEEKVRRFTNNNEPISDASPLIYTERKDGVLPDYNIKTDRWEAAIDAMDYVNRSNTAKREQRLGEKSYDTMTGEQQDAFNKKYPKNKYANQNKTEPQSGASTNE